MKGTDTGLDDHTGERIFEYDCVRFESDHCNNEWNAVIVRHAGRFWTKAINDGDMVELQNVHTSIEVLKTFEEAVETGKLVGVGDANYDYE